MEIKSNIKISVASIIDGDTLKGQVHKIESLPEKEAARLVKACRSENFTECNLTVRFAVIDAIEIDQALGIQAQGFLKQVVKESKGIIDVEIVDVDRYGRLVGFCMGVEDLNLMMVEHGYAVPSFAYINRYVKDDRHESTFSDYAKAQYTATIKKMGLWALKAPVMPADFRKEK